VRYYNEELHISNTIRQITSRRGTCRGVSVGKPERKRPLGRPRHRWEDGIRMDLGESGWGWGSVEWIQLAQDRDQCTYGDEPLGSGPTELVQ
jgi:hypothetical protein